jgi:hypothetical protein
VRKRHTLFINVPVNSEPMVYQCSLFSRAFLLAADRSAKETMTELLAAFKDHIRELHPDDYTGPEGAE